MKLARTIIQVVLELSDNEIERRDMSIRETMERLKELEKQRAKLIAELDCSLALRELWPDAFDKGRVHSHVEGSMQKPSTLRLVVKKEDGERREWGLWDSQVANCLRSRHLSSLVFHDAGQKAKFDLIVKRLKEGPLPTLSTAETGVETGKHIPAKE